MHLTGYTKTVNPIMHRIIIIIIIIILNKYISFAVLFCLYYMGKELSYNYPVTKTAPRTVTGSLSYSSQRSHMADDLRHGLSHSCQRGPTYELFHFQNELPCHVLSRIFKKHNKGCSSSVPTPAHKNASQIRTTSLIFSTFLG